MKESEEISNPMQPLIGGIAFGVAWLTLSYFTEPGAFWQLDTFVPAILGGISFAAVGLALKRHAKGED